MAVIVTLALTSGFFQGASALANWWAEERPAVALDAISLTLFLLAVALAAGQADSAVRWVVTVVAAVIAGVWVSEAAERLSGRLPAVGR